jgi:hypothetical protein
MPRPVSSARLVRASRDAKRRLSFANVTAALALFVALGGSSYAAIRVDSEQIVNNSVSSKDLLNNDLRGRDIRKDTIRGTDIRDRDLQGRDVRDDTIAGADIKESSLAVVPHAQDAQTLAGKPASAFLGSGQLVKTGLVELAHGETKTIASTGPFTWNAACSDDGGGNTRLTITAESTEAATVAADFGAGGQPAAPGAPATVFDQSAAGPLYTIGFPLSAIAPSGAAPVGLAFIGIQVAGADCVANGMFTP